MKKFIKKYPKRILVTALIVLLIAIVGTVNNYQTYRSSHYTVREGSRSVERFVDETVVNRVMKRLDEFYPKEDLAVKKGGHIYYKDINLQPPIGSENWCVDLHLDAEEYRYDDTVTVTIENANAEYVEIYSGEYMLQMSLNGWYSLHTGRFVEKSEDNLVHLENGESYTFDIPLEYISEVNEGPIKLKKGTYRICIYAANASLKTGYVSHNWYSREFEIK